MLHAHEIRIFSRNGVARGCTANTEQLDIPVGFVVTAIFTGLGEKEKMLSATFTTPAE